MSNLKELVVYYQGGYKEIPFEYRIKLTSKFELSNDLGEFNELISYKDGVIFYKNNGEIDENDKKWTMKYYKKYAFVDKNGDKNKILIKDENVEYYSLKNEESIRISSSKKANIQVKDNNCKVLIENEKLYINDQEVFVNGKQFYGTYKITEGDCISVSNIFITYSREYIAVKGDKSKFIVNLQQIDNPNTKFEGFPNYKRSPRIIKNSPTETINILKPPSKIENRKGQLARIIIPPIVMTILTVGICFIMPRGIYIIVSIIGTMMSAIMSVTSYISEKKEKERKAKLRDEVYTKYLLDIRKEVNNLRNKQIESYNYHYPSIEKISKLIELYDSRIYERKINDDDFINVSIGKTRMEPSYNVKFDRESIELEEDELITEAKKIVNKNDYIDDLPVIVSLKKAHLGIVGEKKYVHEQLNIIISQLAFFQSYHDIEIVMIHDEKYRKEFQWTKWYPHLKIKSINATGLVNSERIRDQVLSNLFEVLKDRKLKAEESKKETRFIPHYIFIIDEPILIINHSIMEYLQKESENLGFSMIYTTELKANLPENIKTIFTIDNYADGSLVLDEGILVDKKLSLQHIENINLETMARKLSCINHVQGMFTEIPDSISFLEMYNVKKVEELNISKRWKENTAHKTLSVPLGVRAKDDIVELNLHEKAHGPHGLVAGTTGSGKSEIIQSYILSLAVSFHPYEVGFLLIDYKGGGMASLFKNLPHLLGAITNLDGSESARAMESIKSELSRRQRIFNKYEVNHINQYNKLFKNGEANEPMPHIFLISDEFAELKKEQPEFMSELISAARIGRSLGVHLILATQKPAGVVDEQIWSNSKFKLALKVQDESDSNEILKTPDAANITLPGRAYLQVGNNEIYELFQSAWSGATYNKNSVGEKVDNRVYLINELGQGQLLNKDLSEENEGTNLEKTELDAVIEEINHIFNGMNIEKVQKPWLPSLEFNMVSPHTEIDKVIDINEIDTLDTEVAVGMIDIPEEQAQREHIINFVEDGNLAIFGVSGFGKSTTIMTTALSLAIKNPPKLLKYYVLDFGSASLIMLKDLPHCADYLKLEDDVKLNKLIKLLVYEMSYRKSEFGRTNTSNFKTYNMLSDTKLQSIIIILDNYDVVKELDPEIEDFLLKLSRDGASLGIYMIISATRSTAIKYSIINNFKNKIVHYLLDQMDVNALVGRGKYTLPEEPGRAMVKIESPSIMQVYSSVEAANDIEYTKNIFKLIGKIKDSYTGEELDGIKMLPEFLNVKQLSGYVKEKKNNLIPIGLDIESISVKNIDLDMGINLIIGGPQSGKTNVVKAVLETVENMKQIYLFDSITTELYGYKSNENVKYVSNEENVENFIKEMQEEIEMRKGLFEESRKSGEDILPRNFYNRLPKVLILIDECDYFIEKTKAGINPVIVTLIEDCLNVGISIIGTTSTTKLRGFDLVTKKFKEAISGIIFGNPNDQLIVNVGRAKGNKVPLDNGFIFNKNELVQIKIPKV
ncbi:type VII secretion protein EssC [Clostridium sp. SHJSY1]|uniref:type VII secretion protein EssC n=1 Tax=Clostridium sp. SHJSY1 TaxID=2942483 RepID=UPI00287472D2|nr:type VII secretion protein EssC [Clostridium sp. SHJSY1]MDS0528047.1 type VII secretion protein EssC [Clostridium sp. SHJSY1]